MVKIKVTVNFSAHFMIMLYNLLARQINVIGGVQHFFLQNITLAFI